MARRDDRLQEELQFHLEQQIAKNIRRGMTPDEARRDALIRFGGVEPAREAARDQVRGAWVLDLFRDMRIGLRTLARAPGFAVTAILTLALGIGAASAMFSVFEGILLKPLPYPDAGRIVHLYQLGETGARNRVSDPNFSDWREGTRSFAAMAQISPYGTLPVAGAGDAQLVRVTGVSRAFFEVMAVGPARGRAFRTEEQQPGGPPVAVVSAAFWRRWKGDASPQGEILRSGQSSYAVVGVMPDGFDFPGQTAIWLPRDSDSPNPSRTSHNSQVIARLADGIPLSAAQAETSALSRRLKAQHGDDTWMFDAAAVPLLEVITATSKPTIRLLFAASILLLVVAGTNVSNLLVARAASRRPEFALQLALGATAGRVGRQVLAETLVLCLTGAAVGVLAASSAVRVFVALAPAQVPRLDAVSVSWPAVALATTTAFLAALMLTAVTVAGAGAAKIAESLADSTRSGTGSRRHVRLREGLIVIQVAFTLVLLAGAALLGRSLMSVARVDPGYSLDDGLIVGLTIASDGSAAGRARQVAFHDAVTERLRSQPGVSQVGLISAFPLGAASAPNGMFIEMTRPDEITSGSQFNLSDPVLKSRAGTAEYRLVASDYFKAMRIPVLQGRAIDDRDTASAPPVAVVSESLARLQWPDRSPIGRWIQFGNMDGDFRAIEVVGVVGDVREVSPESQPDPTLYVSARQRPRFASRASLIVRGPSASSLADTARRIIRDLDPNVPAAITTVSNALDEVLGSRRFTVWLVGAFGLAALVLATLGVYGLLAFTVSQRTREMGIRLALGAEPRSLVWLIVRRGAVLAAAGAAAGVALARVASGTLEGLLHGVTPGDPLAVGLAALIMLAAAVGASYAPAQKILKQSPGRTLRGG